MTIAHRNGMAAGRRLPYDAEVEYLESTGTQWIETDILGDPTMRMEIDATFTRTTEGSTNNYMGQTYYTGSYANRFAFGITRTHGCWYAGLGNLNGSWSDAANKSRHSFVLDAVAKTFKVDDSTYVLSYSSWSATSVNIGGISLFGRKLTDTGSIEPYAYMKIWSCRLYKSGVLVRDYQPVRFTNVQGVSEGAMFDRANPTVGMNPDGSARDDGLYRNRGAGAFAIGPDLA